MIVLSKNYRKTIEHFYNDENEFWHKLVHKRGGTIDENIKSTLDTISPKSKMYEVLENGELAAFFVTHHGEIQGLEGFHIAKKYREKDFITRFWDEIKSHFKGDIAMGLMAKNQSAIKHVIRQGFEIVNSDVNKGELYLLLTDKNKKICPSRWGSQEQQDYSN